MRCNYNLDTQQSEISSTTTYQGVFLSLRSVRCIPVGNRGGEVGQLGQDGSIIYKAFFFHIIRGFFFSLVFWIETDLLMISLGVGGR